MRRARRNRARARVCPVCGFTLVRNFKTESGGSAHFCESDPRRISREAVAYNCSPSFNWRKHLNEDDIARFQRELGTMGYKFQFITLAGFHALNHTMFELASDYKQHGMTAYSRLQEAEFASERDGNYGAVKHQRFVGTGYFDEVQRDYQRHRIHDGARGFNRGRAVSRSSAGAPARRTCVAKLGQQLIHGLVRIQGFRATFGYKEQAIAFGRLLQVLHSGFVGEHKIAVAGIP